MESGLASDEVAIVAEGDAALGDDGIEVGEGVEVLVDDGFVDVGPEGFGGLQLGRVGRQEDEADAFGDGERLGVPAGAVEDEDDDPVASGSGCRIRRTSRGSSTCEKWSSSTARRDFGRKASATWIMAGAPNQRSPASIQQISRLSPFI